MTGLGAAVTVRAEDESGAALLPTLTRLWDWCLPSGPADSQPVGADVVVPPHRPEEADSILQRLSQAVTQSLIAARAGQLFLFHAAAICHPTTGATLMAVAPGNTGKTTLAARFGRRYGYLTDETAGVADDGRMVPYQKPLSIRREGRPKQETSPSDLGLVRPTVEPWLAAVALLSREGLGRSGVEVLELPLLDAITAMAPESSSLSSMQRPLHRLRDLLAPVEPVLRVGYAEADTLAGLVEELLGTP